MNHLPHLYLRIYHIILFSADHYIQEHREREEATESKSMPRLLPLPKPHQLPRLPHPLPNTINTRLRQPRIRPTPRPPLPSAHTPAHTRARTTINPIPPGTTAAFPSTDETAALAGRVLGAHRRQHVLAGRQRDEERKRHEPDAEPKVRRYFRESRDLRVRHEGGVGGVGRRWERGGEVAEPEVVV